MKDLTPSKFKCSTDDACPSVHDLEDGRLLIVGSFASTELVRAAGLNLGDSEEAFVIEKALLENVR